MILTCFLANALIHCDMPMTKMMQKKKILFTVVLPFDTLGEPPSSEENRTKGNLSMALLTIS